MAISRLRIFAGPNGSGKSTLKTLLDAPMLGVYLNTDDIELGIRETGRLDLTEFGLTATAEELRRFFYSAELLRIAGLSDDLSKLKFSDGRIDYSNTKINSYFAAVSAEFLRELLLAGGETFTFETVMLKLPPFFGQVVRKDRPA